MDQEEKIRELEEKIRELEEQNKNWREREKNWRAHVEDWRDWRGEVKKHFIREGEWRERERGKFEDFKGIAGDVVAEANDARAALGEMCDEERIKWRKEKDEVIENINWNKTVLSLEKLLIDLKIRFNITD